MKLGTIELHTRKSCFGQRRSAQKLPKHRIQLLPPLIKSQLYRSFHGLETVLCSFEKTPQASESALDVHAEYILPSISQA